MASLTERFCAGLLGVAAGDALGATLEFMSREEVARRFGVLREIIGGGWLNLGPGEVTDDTQMTLAVAEGILEDPANPVAAIGRRFIAWHDANPPDIGCTCRCAIAAARPDGNWQRAAQVVRETLGDRAAGNGSLMRTLPVALAYYGNDSTVKSMAERVSSMTHPTKAAALCCQLYCLLVCRLLDGLGKRKALEWLRNYARALGPLPTDIEAALRQEADTKAPQATGYVVNSLAAALWAFLGGADAEECIVRAANLGDDADTVAAIAGGLAGVYYGALPERWLRALNECQYITDVATRLARLHG